MIPAPFSYHRPRTVAAALRLLEKHGPDAKIVAGGQSMLPMMKLRVATPAHLVDIGRISALKRIALRGGWLRLGALATHWEIETAGAVARGAPLMAETAAAIGDLQVRNLGTLGGTLAHADPAADYPAAVLALGAEIVAQGPGGIRTIGSDEFFLGPMMSALDPLEVLTEVRLRAAPARSGAAYLKIANPASGYALAGVAAVVVLDRYGACSHVRVGVTGVASTAYRALQTERFLEGKEPGDEQIESAAQAASAGVEASSDIHAGADYRLHLARVLARRALLLARDRSRARRARRS